MREIGQWKASNENSTQFWAFQEKHLLTLLRRDAPLNIRRTVVASSAIARAIPQSIAGWRGFAVSYPSQFFRTNPYDVISSSCFRRPAATAINFHPATGQTTSGKRRHPNPMFTFGYGYGRARLFDLKIQLCRFTWFERRIIDGSFHGTIHNQCHPVIACRETL